MFVENELKVGYRKAMYLIKGYGAWNKYGLTQEDFTAIGWTKAIQISDVMDSENAQELVELAKESSVNELKETIKESYVPEGKDTREVVKKVTFKFRLVEDQAATIQDYLEMAASQLEEKKLDAVFEHIVSEWATEHLDVSAMKKRGKAKAASKKTTSKKSTARKTTAKKQTRAKARA